MKHDIFQNWKFLGFSTGFHALIGGVVLFGLNWTSIEKNEFSNAIIVNLVQAGEPKKEESTQPEEQEAKKVSAPRKLRLPEPEPAVVPQMEAPDKAEPAVQETELLSPMGVSQDLSDSVLVEEKSMERVVLLKIPRSSLAGLVSDAVSVPELTGEGDEENSAASSEVDREEFNRFLSEIRVRLEQAKRYPLMARIRGQEGIVQIAFRINSLGKAEDVHLIQSSRWPILNREALNTVNRIDQFGQPPRDWKEGMEVKVPLAFRFEGP